MALDSQSQQPNGKLVALEGDVHTISTQLQLLPPSQKILVLPSLLASLPQDTDAHSFNARAYIRHVHTTFTERTERARSFLESSTTTQPRLVFANGGSVSARTACISKICDFVTHGDLREAENVFNEIVKDGIAGLLKEEVPEEENNANEMIPESGEVIPEEVQVEEDPTFTAMKAADSLDRETAELQNDHVEDSAVDFSTDVLEGDAKALPQTMSDSKQDTFSTSNGDDIVTTVLTIKDKTSRSVSRLDTFGPEGKNNDDPSSANLNASTPFTAALSHQAEEDDYDYDCDDDHDHENISAPATPGVVYGEARVVDVASVSPKRSARRVQSFEVLPPRASTFGDWASTSPPQIRHTKSAYHLGMPSTSSGRSQDDTSIPNLPKSAFMRAFTTVIKKPSSLTGSRSSSISTPRMNVYVDRGTDAEEMLEEEAVLAVPMEKDVPFEPVFPLAEDLVIRFASDAPNETFEYVISAYKNGSYPVLPAVPETETADQESHESLDGSKFGNRPTSYLTAETDDDGFQRRHDFDPYADNNYPAGVNQWPAKEKSLRASPLRNLQPPTPSMTPPPTARGVPEKFCEFMPMDPNSVIGIQNSFRSLLNLHFPAGDEGYSQYSNPVSSEMDRFWKPVFRNDVDSPIGSEGRTVDQIIALGCEEGVKKDFFEQISAQIEKSGIKREGLNKTSKIDIRYFIATAMQTHSNLPLSVQSVTNPFASPDVLAAHIVPQIESYLATNISTRLLILHYPADQLATVLALRRILGQDILKVTGIVDTLSSDPPSAVTKPIFATNPLSNEATLNLRRPSQTPARDSSLRRSIVSSPSSSVPTTSNDHLRKDSVVSFSKANYLLPSSATESEIVSFLSAISTALVESSAFYAPEPEPEPKTIVVEKIVERIIEKPTLPPTPSSRDAAYPPVSFRNGQSRESKLARLTGEKTPPRSKTPPRTPTGSKGHKYAASVASQFTTRTTASERGRREDARIERDWENFYIGEEDSDDDDYDRMILGREMAKIVPEVRKVYADPTKAPKRSTKKALKWLGLA